MRKRQLLAIFPNFLAFTEQILQLGIIPKTEN